MKLTGADIIERIDGALTLKRTSRKELYLSLGLASNTFSNWEARKTIPAADVALRIADYLGVSIRWLVTGKDEEGLTLEERNLLTKYSSLDERDRYEVNALLDAKLDGSLGGLKKAGNP